MLSLEASALAGAVADDAARLTFRGKVRPRADATGAKALRAASRAAVPAALPSGAASAGGGADAELLAPEAVHTSCGFPDAADALAVLRPRFGAAGVEAGPAA